MQTLTLPAILPDQEAEFLARLRSGDAHAVAHVYAQHHAPLCSFARRFLGDDQAAEDLIHDVFVSLPDLIHKFEAGRSMRGFLFGVVANRARHYMRAAARRRAFATRLLRQTETAADASLSPSCPQAHIERRKLAEALRRALDNLSLDQRLVFTLCELEELSGPEVAEMLGVPEGTIRTRLHHARKRIRAHLEQEGVL
jgi:RNA polymerase sigma-70 factor (ECF subfamily)